MKTTHQSRALPLSELQANYERQVVDGLRLAIALRRANAGCYIRFRRAALTGPNADKTLVFVYRPGGGVTVSAVSNESLDRLRQEVTEAEALAVMGSRAARMLGEDIDEP